MLGSADLPPPVLIRLWAAERFSAAVRTEPYPLSFLSSFRRREEHRVFKFSHRLLASEADTISRFCRRTSIFLIENTL